VWGDVPTYVVVPMADGGDGTVDAFLASGAAARTLRVRGPVGTPADATYARDGETAIIEMASASGLALAGDARDARRATTYGTGELIRDALDAGAARIVLGIGGSATTDGGAGALAALGMRFLDRAGRELEPLPHHLDALERIDAEGLDPRLTRTPIAIACDVDNPLLGPHGAAAVYGPQKGAAAADVTFLDGVLARFARIAVAAGRPDLRELPGAGAAGGLGWGLATFAGAQLAPGFDLIAQARGLAAALATATLCMTGEGRIDEQTLRGKVVAGVARLARRFDIPVIAFGGSVDIDAERALAALGVVCTPIADGPQSLAQAMTRTTELMRAAASRVARLRMHAECCART
jgi:glycerate kinase